MKPLTLYKYRHFDAKGFALRILTHNEIYFASPSEFNDPFDCRVAIDYHNGTLAEKNKHWRPFIQKHMSHLTARQRDALLKDLVNNRLTDPVLIENSRRFTEEYPGKNLGVFSLASNHSSLLMWSHYAASHTGMAIGFHHGRFTDYCYQVHHSLNRLLSLREVIYSTTYPQVNPYHHTNTQRMELQLLSKSIEWAYEGEYRGLLFKGPSEILSIPENLISRVVLGCRIEDANRNIVLTQVANRKMNIPVYQAKQSSTEYRLTFKRIN